MRGGKYSFDLNMISMILIQLIPNKDMTLFQRWYNVTTLFQCYFNRIGGVMVSMFDSSAVNHGFQLKLGQTKDYKIGICCFSAKHAALRRKSRLLFQWVSTIKIQLSLLFYVKEDLFIISLKINLFFTCYKWKIAELAFNNNH